ncbi:LytR/AlgR family response regulator transcription factor [Dyadobacter pollutisoli]|uniref:LytTR family transcriptional regulator DNA-binding domain-containing protein n=1 Tax=Dyadobacter pollutisoli TaxID=2910158 RepID=A0A9E8NE80_9BACT|nr:LytTR family transcriptional regulator DNA-binding domain-containing protein [Dyadobacter pollutisoli]WAC12687.1 LytTR family transcriptional regulator DNA-binding domain-containing protein [Dyadobacter pollutisoli]
MNIAVKLLIVEDDMIVAADIALQLSKLGYEVSGIVLRGEEAIRHVETDRPDLILLDISLKGLLDGIETAQAIHQRWNIPIIYVTTNTDEATFTRAKNTRPYAFISKPIRPVELQRTIELAVTRLADEHHPASNDNSNKPFVLSDRIFVRLREKIVKIFIADILYVEADRNYCHLFTANKEYLMTTTLKVMEDKLPANHFVRVHRSYLVNLTQVDEVSDGHVSVMGKSIPLSHNLREGLLKRFTTI